MATPTSETSAGALGEVLEQAAHAALGVDASLLFGAVAVDEDGLELAERVLGPQLAGVGAGGGGARRGRPRGPAAAAPRRAGPSPRGRGWRPGSRTPRAPRGRARARSGAPARG